MVQRLRRKMALQRMDRLRAPSMRFRGAIETAPMTGHNGGVDPKRRMELWWAVAEGDELYSNILQETAERYL
jgi:hypothetical protein